MQILWSLRICKCKREGQVRYPAGHAWAEVGGVAIRRHGLKTEFLVIFWRHDNYSYVCTKIHVIITPIVYSTSRHSVPAYPFAKWQCKPNVHVTPVPG